MILDCLSLVKTNWSCFPRQQSSIIASKLRQSEHSTFFRSFANLLDETNKTVELK